MGGVVTRWIILSKHACVYFEGNNKQINMISLFQASFWLRIAPGIGLGPRDA